MRLISLFFLIALIGLACSTAQKVINPATMSYETEVTTPSLTWTPSPSPLPTTTSTPEFVCANAPETHLRVGDHARVTETKGPAVRLRRDPVVVNDNILKLLPNGMDFEIIDGPVCASNPETGTSFVFWQISIPGDPLKGWVAEGDASNYYIEPLPTQEKMP